MKVRAKADGFIRVPTPKGERSRLMEKGVVFELPKGTDIAPWMEEAKDAPAMAKTDAKTETAKIADPAKKGTGDSEVI